MTLSSPLRAQSSLPRAVAMRLARHERELASVVGAQASGMALTDTRVIRWRPPGSSLSLPLAAVARITLHNAGPGHPATLIVEASDGRPALVVSLAQHHLPAVASFIAGVVSAVVLTGQSTGRPQQVQETAYGPIRTWVFRPV